MPTFITRELHYPKYIWVFVIIIIQSGAQPVVSLLLGNLVNDFNSVDSIIFNLSFIAGISVLNGIISSVQGQLISLVVAARIRQVRHNFFARLLHKQAKFFDVSSQGSLIQLITSNIEEAQFFIRTALPELVSSFAGVVISIILISYIFWPFGLILIGLALLDFGLIYVAMLLSKKRFAQRQQITSLLNSSLMEILLGWRSIKVFAKEGFFLDQVDRSAKKVAKTEVSASLVNNIFAAIIVTINMGTIVGIGWLGYAETIKPDSQIKIGSIITAWFYVLTVASSLKTGVIRLTDIWKYNATNAKIVDTLKPGEYEDIACQSLHTNQKWDIEIKNLVYAYDSSSNFSLSIEQINIPQNTVTALVGQSGSGKSTLVSLLLKLYQDYQGSILIGGQEIRNLHSSWIYSQVSFVPQETHIYNGTIEENIRYGNLTASFGEIEDAAKLADAHDFITETTDGYKTFIGDKGVKLSGGQKQRIAIARAMLVKPKILIFDEATSALDSESENQIKETVEKLRKMCTIIIVAHRLSSIKSADNIIVMQNGFIVEEGDFATLKSREGIFAKMLQFQNLQITTGHRTRSNTL